MKQFIIYNTPEGEVALISPWLESGLTIEEIAAKDVPSGLKYKIISEDDIPKVPQSVWYVDEENLTDGVGL